MRRVEALADALARMYGALDPLSDSYKLRNPMMLKAFSPAHRRNEKGYRQFEHFVAGYENGVLDLKIKCSGRSRAKIGPESTLEDLLHVYGQPSSALKSVVRFLRHALDDDAIPESVQLKFFIEDLPPEDRYAVRPD